MYMGLGARQRGRVLLATASCVALGTLLTLWSSSLPVRWAAVRCAQVMPSQSLGKCDVTVRYSGAPQSSLSSSICTHTWPRRTPERRRAL